MCTCVCVCVRAHAYVCRARARAFTILPKQSVGFHISYLCLHGRIINSNRFATLNQSTRSDQPSSQTPCPKTSTHNPVRSRVAHRQFLRPRNSFVLDECLQRWLQNSRPRVLLLNLVSFKAPLYTLVDELAEQRVHLEPTVATALPEAKGTSNSKTRYPDPSF